MRNRLALFSLTILLVACDSDREDLQQFVDGVRAETTGIKLPPLPEVVPYYPEAYTGENLKDPFLPSQFVRNVEPIAEQVNQNPRNRPNLKRPRGPLEKYSLSALKMVGTVNMTGHLWALIQAPNGGIYRVQIRQYIGNNHGRITKITPEKIELVEHTQDANGLWQKRDASLVLTVTDDPANQY